MTIQRFEKFLMIVFSTLVILAMASACTPAENEGAAQADSTATSEPTAEPTEPATEVPTDPQVDTVENQLVGTKWDLISMDGTLVGNGMTLDFLADRVSGSDGCNNFGGGYSIVDGKFVFDEAFAVTEMLCLDESVMEMAQQYLNALVTAGEFTLDDDGLTIETENGQLVFGKAVSAELTNTRWQLGGLNNGTGGIVHMAIDDNIFFMIDGNMVSGNGGCNGFGGDVTIDGNNITFANLISTMMACAEDDKTQRESEFLAALPNVASYEITRQTLNLFDADGDLVANFVASEAMEMNSETKTLYVGAEQVDCVGVGPQKCLLVKENLDEDYTFFYDSIDGFEWEAGYEYELLVNVTEVENPPADASSLRYELVEVVSKTEVEMMDNEQPEIRNITWRLIDLIVGGDASVPAPADAEVTLEITDDGVSGNAGCNTFGGSAEIDGDSITFGPLATTRMSCGESVDQFEFGVLEMFANVTRYTVKQEDGVLVLWNGELPVAQFAPPGMEIETGLPGGELPDEGNLELVGTSWQWTAFQDTADINSIEVADPTLYVITFNDDGSYGLKNDCNVGGGDYALDGSSLTIMPGIATQAYCGDDSLDQEFSRLLGEVVTYVIEDGQLHLNLKLDSGNLVFSPQ